MDERGVGSGEGRSPFPRILVCGSRGFGYNARMRPLRFYFITVTCRNREPIFGRLVESEPGPARAPRKNPRAKAIPHRCRGRVDLTPMGQHVQAVWARLGELCPGVVPSERCVMPDHFHGLFFIDFERCPIATPEATIARFLQETGAETWNAEAPFVITPFGRKALSQVRRYIRGNPDRALWKRNHPDRFFRMENLRHPILPPEASWTALGNLPLLACPFLFAVQISRRASPEAIETAVQGSMARMRSGYVPFGGFLSPGERAVLDAIQRNRLGPYIRLLPYGIPVRYDPSLEFSREVSEDGALLLSPFPESVPWGVVTRQNCLVMNALGERMEALSMAWRGEEEE